MRIASLCSVLVALACCTPVTPDPGPIVTAAQEYPQYGRVDDLLRWAPTLCAPPPPAAPRLSLSRDVETHGRKLYYLYAKDYEAYRIGADRPQPLGQILVKEAWMPAAGSTAKKLLIGEKGPLFVMMKTGEPDSDAGWIYATLTPDGRTVTASGKLASCMECHESMQDRLFGIKSCASAR